MIRWTGLAPWEFEFLNHDLSQQALALDTLKDLFVNQLLPNRKLRYFHEIASASHSALGGDEADKEAVFWSAP